MKKIAAMRNACLAAAGIVATGAFLYGLAFVAFPQVKSRVAYRDPGPRPLRLQPPPNDVSSIWTQKLGDMIVPVKEQPFEATLVGTTKSAGRSNTFAVVNGASGQALLRPGDLFQGAVLASVNPGEVTFSLGSRSIPRKIERPTGK